MNKRMHTLKTGLLLSVIPFFFFSETTFAQWQIVYSDQLINELRQQGISYAKRQGNFSTETECKQMIDQAVSQSGDPYIRGKMHCEKCDGTSSTSYGGSSGSGDFNQQLVETVAAPLIQGLFDWIFSPSTDENTTSQGHSNVYVSPTPRPLTEEEIRLAKEKQEKWKQQVEKVQAEYSQILSENFSDQQKNTANDFKNRIVKSEAMKNIKQLNCASQQSIEAAETVLLGNGNFEDPDGSMENMRSLSDFTNPKSSDCPEIKYVIPDVSTANPVGFQQMIYQAVKYKADSIKVNVELLKEKETSIKKVIEEKKQAVEELKLNPPENDGDQLLKEALAALNESVEEGNSVDAELNKSKTSLENLENIRSTYDLEKPQK